MKRNKPNSWRPLVVVGLLVASGLPFATPRCGAQGAGVPAYLREAPTEDELRAAAAKLAAAGQLVRDTVLTGQFNRATCVLKLPAPRDRRLSGRELWAAARAAHLRVGWYFLCTKCTRWHCKLSAGYALTRDGAVATCFHVVRTPETSREGFLIAADEDGRVYPVTEILAANPDRDVCLVRVQSDKLKPLALNTNVFPGDRCACFSDPLGERGYYSEGIINRFLERRVRPGGNVLRLNVTTDWAPGSSGAAVLDECGNAIGHVTSIAALSDHANSRGTNAVAPTLITLHEAVSARDVLALVRAKGKNSTR